MPQEEPCHEPPLANIAKSEPVWKIPVAAVLFVPGAAWADPSVEKKED